MLLKWTKDDLMKKDDNKINMRFPRFGILVFISYCIVNQKYFDLEGSAGWEMAFG